jgi:hypothetical protein
MSITNCQLPPKDHQAQVECAICRQSADSSKMCYCHKDNIWVHYACAGGGNWASAKCPLCGKNLG